MADWHKLAETLEIPAGTGREFVVQGRVIAVFHVAGEHYAIDGLCPHAGGPIGTGTVRGCVVTCPWHGWQFDVTTGVSKLSSSIQTARFTLEQRDDGWWLELPESAAGQA
jgi:nitrite reductase (NADH) small subunit